MQLSLDEVCPICFETFKQPVRLPCKHVFCTNCIHRALQKKQHCPLCRRISCNLIRDTYEPFHFNNTEYSKKDGLDFHLRSNDNKQDQHTTLPSFQDKFFAPLEGEAELFFFEPYCIQLVNFAIKNDLQFCVDSNITNKDGSSRYCDIYEITHVQPTKVQRNDVYYCRVRNKGRALKIHENLIPIQNSDKNLSLINLKVLEDDLEIKSEKIIQIHQDLTHVANILTEGQGNPKFLSLVSLNDEVWKEIQQFIQIPSPTLTIVSKLSLQILCYLKMPRNSFNSYYYSNNLENRVEVLKKHSKAIHKIMTDGLF